MLAVDTVSLITPHEEAELRWYFEFDLPPAPGTTSTFGAMCERMGNAVNRKTKELPSGDATWTEIVSCGFGSDGGGRNTTEDRMLDYIGAKRRIARMVLTLEQLSDREVDVLRARYTMPDGAPAPLGEYARVALLTRAARAENLRRGGEETVLESVTRLLVALKTPGQARDAARAKLLRIRQEAMTLVGNAVEAFVVARESVR